jgi:hypothetical protein
MDPKNAKLRHGRKGMNEVDAVLDLKKWDEMRVDVMKRIIACRAMHDTIFVDALTKLAATTEKLLHFERSSRKRPSFWGGFYDKELREVVGQNVLGNIIQEHVDSLRPRPQVPDGSPAQLAAQFPRDFVTTLGLAGAVSM